MVNGRVTASAPLATVVNFWGACVKKIVVWGPRFTHVDYAQNTQTDTQTDTHTRRHRQRHSHRQTDGQTDRRTDGQTDRQIDTQIDGWAMAAMSSKMRGLRESQTCFGNAKTGKSLCIAMSLVAFVLVQATLKVDGNGLGSGRLHTMTKIKL